MENKNNERYLNFLKLQKLVDDGRKFSQKKLLEMFTLVYCEGALRYDPFIKIIIKDGEICMVDEFDSGVTPLTLEQQKSLYEDIVELVNNTVEYEKE